MAFPSEPRAFDTMLGVPSNRGAWQETFGTLVRDSGSGGLAHPAGYMFKDLPEVDGEVPFDAFDDQRDGSLGRRASGLLPVTLRRRRPRPGARCRSTRTAFTAASPSTRPTAWTTSGR